MTFKQLVRALCTREGKKHGVNIADMSEIVHCLGDILNDPKVDRYAVIHTIEHHNMEYLIDRLKQRGILTSKKQKKAKRKLKQG